MPPFSSKTTVTFESTQYLCEYQTDFLIAMFIASLFPANINFSLALLIAVLKRFICSISLYDVRRTEMTTLNSEP